MPLSPIVKEELLISKKTQPIFKNFFFSLFPKDGREHIVAAWVLEKYTLEKLGLLTPVFSNFLNGVAQQKNESKRRPMIKLLFHYCKDKKRRKGINTAQRDQIVTLCFDYMLEAKKAAALAFSMKTLHFFRHHQDWIEGNCKPISSNAYQTAVLDFVLLCAKFLKIDSRIPLEAYLCSFNFQYETQRFKRNLSY